MLRAENGHHRADDVHHAKDVHVEIGADFGVSQFFNRADQDVTGVVHHHVQPPEMGAHRFDAARSFSTSRVVAATR